MHTYRCGTIRGQKCCVKGSGNEAKSKSLCTYIDTTNVELEM
jgi:hypothetical protein